MDHSMSDQDTLRQADTPRAAVDEMLPVLHRLGHHIVKRPVLFARVCRICATALHGARADELLRERIETIIDCALLPATTLIPANPGLVYELWRLFELLPYTSRYRAYGVLSRRLKEDIFPELTLVRSLARA